MSSWIMRRTSSFGLGLSVCGAVAALAVGQARADDGVTIPADPAAIVAAVAAAVPSMPEPQGPTAPQLPTPPETPVIPPVSAAVPPVIPPAPAEVTRPSRRRPSRRVTGTAPATPAAPVVAAQPEPAPAPQPLPRRRPRRRHLILPILLLKIQMVLRLTSSTTPPQTFIWNWYWNCATDEAMPAVPAPPAGATTIVLNWHWACAEPPPRSTSPASPSAWRATSPSPCGSGSPGNTGDLAQTIAAQTAAAAADIAETIQTALQAAPPAAAPLRRRRCRPSAAVIPPVAAPAIAPAALPRLRAYPIDAGLFVAPLGDAAAEDPPRHGAPSSFGVAAGPQRRERPRPRCSSAAPLAGARHASRLPPASCLQRSTVGAAGAGSRSSAAGARRPARAGADRSPFGAGSPFVLAAGCAVDARRRTGRGHGDRLGAGAGVSLRGLLRPAGSAGCASGWRERGETASARLSPHLSTTRRGTTPR